MYSIGIDIGGTTIKAAAYDGKTIVSEVYRYNTVDSNGVADVRKAADTAIEDIRLYMDSSPSAIGIGTPGLVDSHGYLSGDAVNIPGWVGVQVRDYFSERWKVSTSVANDVNMAAYGEWKLGAGAELRKDAFAEDFVCISLGTGVGSGLIINGNIVIGSQGMAGEIGHIVVEPDGRLCNCGLRGCLERYSSATGLNATARELAPSFQSPFSAEILKAEDPAFPDARRIYEELALGDALAEEIHRRSSRHLAIATGIIAQSIDPAMIVFTGGVLQAGDIILEGIHSHLHRYVMPMSLEALRVRRGKLGDLAGVWGAAAFAWDGRE